MKSLKLKNLLLIAFFTAYFSSSASFAQSSEDILKKVDFHFLVDPDSEEILLEKNIDSRIAPSSMTKIMTAYVIFDQIAKGNISLNKQCKIGKDAWLTSGSTMFLNYGDRVTIKRLVRGLLAVSGNDAAVALAHAASGSVKEFAKLMNKTAKKIGLKNSQFKNPHGLNENGHFMSLRDLAIVATRIYKDYPQYADYLAIEEFTYGNITQRNRHPLIKRHYEGVLGGKTGHTNKGGYGVIGIVKRDHRRLIGVINKARTPRMREKGIIALFDYGFAKYKKLVLFNKNETVTNLKSWLGAGSVEVITKKDVAINILRNRPLSDIKVKVKYKGPIYAPIKKGKKVGDLIIEVKGYKTFKYPLYTKYKVKQVGYLRRVNRILRYKIANFLNKVFK